MPDLEDLSISPDQICFLVVKARQLGAKDVVTEPDPGSNPSDDGSAAILEDHRNDPIRREIVGFVQALNADQKLDLITLASLGRGDGEFEDWKSLRAETASATASNVLDEFLETPLLGDYLEEALSMFGASCGDTQSEHL